MDRSRNLQILESSNSEWDFVVIGGGATGLGVAVDAVSRGFKTILVEKSDFTQGTSSRSTKLVHGGVRYLGQGDIGLVMEALYERGLVLQNAPHLCSNQEFVIPAFSYREGIFYTLGLKLYDLLSGSLSLGKSQLISKNKIDKLFPTLNKARCKCGILYHDGQFDDARLGINLAETCSKLGGVVLNYFPVEDLEKDNNGNIVGVKCIDLETGKSYFIKSKVVINATGVFSDQIIRLEDRSTEPMISPSQGAHIVLDKKFLPGKQALLIPKTEDGRVLFAVPWYDKIVVGTTDTLMEKIDEEPKPLQKEIDFILSTFSHYCSLKPTRSDVLSVFAGLRPLARPTKSGKKTKEISRRHKIFVSKGNLLTVTGGKWTTYRRMAQDTVDLAIKKAGLAKVECNTKSLHIHGYMHKSSSVSWLSVYGTDEIAIRSLMDEKPEFREKLHPNYPYVKAEVVWAIRNEMARRIEDILARRLRLLFLDAKAAIEVCEVVANIICEELNKDIDWKNREVQSFLASASRYVI